MPTRRRTRLTLGLATMAWLALAVPVVLAADRDVEIRDFAFAPATVEVRVGDSVTWTNRDGVAHTATAQNGSWDTGLLEEGRSGAIRFTVPGTYRYLCTPHPNMTGTVTVRAASPNVRPPDTDAAPLGGVPAGATGSGPDIAGLATVAGLAFLVVRRRLAGRHETD